MKQRQIAVIKDVFRALWVGLLLCVLFFRSSVGAASDRTILLAIDGHATAGIVLPSRPGEVLQFAARELRKYLSQLSGAPFDRRTPGSTASAKIALAVSSTLPFEGYSISVRSGDILLTGGSERAVLYAVYDFLGRLGCMWLAPDFAFYHGHAGCVPHLETLCYHAGEDVVETPTFRFRKLDIIGRNSTVQDLLKIIDWMAKLRFNTVMIPFGSSLDRWDKLRKKLVPELRKRGLLLELGGHGYQYFLSSAQDGGRLFRRHPDWFGRDSNCLPVRSDRMVFNTDNPEAVHYFIYRVVRYLRKHPEVSLFDFWPPDGAEWPACDPSLSYAGLRQAVLANRVDSAIKTLDTGVRLEIIAYDLTLLPPNPMILHPDILVDICPINQNFESQIGDTAVGQNGHYVSALESWKTNFSGQLGIYSYYRKSAWRSLPVVIPYYIQRDLKWYAGQDMKGISCYAYHDDWFTYELNHYVLGQVAWNPEVKVDSVLRLFCRVRYGAYAGEALSAALFCGQAVRTMGSLPFIRPKAASQIAVARSTLERHKIELVKARSETRDSVVAANLSRLLLMLDYLKRDLSIQQWRSQGAPRNTLEQEVRALGDFLSAHGREGVFQLSSQHQMLLLRKHYGLTNQSLLDL